MGPLLARVRARGPPSPLKSTKTKFRSRRLFCLSSSLAYPLRPVFHDYSSAKIESPAFLSCRTFNLLSSSALNRRAAQSSPAADSRGPFLRFPTFRLEVMVWVD